MSRRRGCGDVVRKRKEGVKMDGAVEEAVEGAKQDRLQRGKQGKENFVGRGGWEIGGGVREEEKRGRGR